MGLLQTKVHKETWLSQAKIWILPLGTWTYAMLLVVGCFPHC
jgi:hypothetical protein